MSFFSLVTELENLLDQLNTILAGTDDETVTVNGVEKDSISKAIRDKFSAIQALVQGRLAYENKSEMDGAGAPPNSELAQVWNDPVADNNGLYGWNGLVWVKSKYGNELEQLTTDMYVSNQKLTSLEDVMYKGGIHQYLLGDSANIVPVIVGENNKVALAFDKSTGELIAEGLDRINSSQARYAPVISDESGQLALLVDKDTGQLLFDPHFTSMALGLNRVGIFERDLEDIAFAIVDDKQQVAFSIDHTGNVSFSDKSGSKNTSIENNKKSIDTEINHFLFSGQSLSVGANGQPVLSTSQPYGNITFTGGPRSDLDELSSFKPLVEDNNLAPDGAANRGETVVSGAANFVTELIEQENGLSHTSHSYDLLGSTVGHGGYRIDQLNKGSAWYEYLISHVQAGFDLAQEENKSYSLQAIGWIQGENDQFEGSKGRDIYKNDLIKYQMDVQSDVQSITGQSHRVPLLTYQLGCYVTNGGNYQNVTLAQLDAAEESNNIYLTCPMYHLPYSDGVHLNNVGYKWLGHYFGKVYKRVVYEGKEWVPLSPKSIFSQGKVITLEMNVPNPPIFIDELHLPKTKDFGFVVEDDDGVLVIQNVEVIGPTRLKIVVDRNLSSNPELRYGLDNKAAGLTHTNGGSGNLRDSDPLFWQLGSSEYPLFNWCVMFKKAIN